MSQVPSSPDYPPPGSPSVPPPSAPPPAPGGGPPPQSNKVVVGVLAILLGWLGVHKFMLGLTTPAVILLVLGLAGFVTCGITSMVASVIGIIEGIIYLTKTDDQFYQEYVVGKKQWF